MLLSILGSNRHSRCRSRSLRESGRAAIALDRNRRADRVGVVAIARRRLDNPAVAQQQVAAAKREFISRRIGNT